MSESYLKSLDRALSKIPKKASASDRYDLPELSMGTMGKRTFIYNFADICQRLNRTPQHLLKFLSKEMAAAGTYDGGRAIFQGKFSREAIARIIQIYSNRFVVCPICKMPDSRMEKEGRFHFLVCEACGAKSSIPPM